MNKKSTKILITFLVLVLTIFSQENQLHKQNYGIVIHGGAGSIIPGKYTQEQEEEYRIKLNEALDAGFKILEDNGSSLDAIEAAIKILEDSPLFNAAKGAVFTSNGLNELDASIMNGKTQEAGAVAGLRHIRNPISLARAVMEKSKHVMMIGNGAEQFAIQNRFELVDSSYFFTQERWDDLQRVLENEKKGKSFLNDPESKFGTVGAAALDKHGNLAAGTSTGGMTNKKFGRVGDVPIIGAGTYAKNNTCAISATGHGEYFIRLNVAHDISAMMEYQNKTLQQATDEVIYEKLQKLGGTGGVVAIDKDGNIAMPFNTPGMFRGYKLEGKDPVVLFFKDNQ